MNIVIFGATGSVGRELVKQALDRGYNVTGVARDPSKIVFEHKRPRILTGDVMDKTAVEAAIDGQDAVISAIGTPATTRNTTRSQGTKNIIDAMWKLDVKRLISLSSLGVGDSRPMLPFFYKYILVPFLLKQGFGEHELQEKFIRESKTEWTIVRPGAYTNGELTGKYKHGFPVTEKNIKAKISRADVADFMLKQLTDDSYVKSAASISY